MTTGDFDFFGAPTSPPPTGPAAPEAPLTNQFGMPSAPPTNQFGLPAMATARPAVIAPAPESGGKQLMVVGAAVAAVVLAIGGVVWLKSFSHKTTTKVTDTIETPIVKAHQTAETIDLQQAVMAEQTYLADHNVYAASVTDLQGFQDSPTTKVTVVTATGTAYCLRADDLSTFHAPSMYVSSADSSASTTPCS